jgi:hypothetical protein
MIANFGLQNVEWKKQTQELRVGVLIRNPLGAVLSPFTF